MLFYNQVDISTNNKIYKKSTFLLARKLEEVMIKIKKIIFAVGIAALLCSSCKLQSQIDDLTKENEKLEKELAKAKKPDAKTATPGASSADVVTVRINKARGFV